MQGKGFVFTAKTQIGFVSGLFELAVEEGHLKYNPARGLTKRLEQPKVKVDKVFNPESDRLINNLHQHHQDLYWMIRWSGMRLGEAAAAPLRGTCGICGLDRDTADMELWL